LLSPTSSIRLPKFLTNDPQSPARYDGTPISPGYQSSRDATGAKEQWYFPPDKPSPKQQHAKRSKRVSKSRDSDPTTRSQNFQSSNFSETFTPRGSSSPEEYFPLSPKRSLDPVEETVPFTPLQIHDLRNEKRILYADVEIRSGVLYDLIQTLPSTWLTTPQIKESFIPLLRANRETTQVRAPTPNELRLIEGFLTHLPDVHIIPAKRFNRISPTWDTKTNLFLSDEVCIWVLCFNIDCGWI
jgi:hypothetical protein